MLDFGHACSFVINFQNIRTFLLCHKFNPVLLHTSSCSESGHKVLVNFLPSFCLNGSKKGKAAASFVCGCVYLSVISGEAHVHMCPSDQTDVPAGGHTDTNSPPTHPVQGAPLPLCPFLSSKVNLWTRIFIKGKVKGPKALYPSPLSWLQFMSE